MKKHPTIELLESLNDVLIYALETATSLAILYLVYHLLLRKEKSFQYNRIYLLSALVLSFTFPLLNFNFNPELLPNILNSIHQVGNEVSNEPIIEAERVFSFTITANSERPYLLWWEILLIIYVVGFSYQLLKFCLRIRLFKETIWYKRHSTRFKNQGYYFVNTEGSLPTFSFLNYLFWDDSQCLSEQEKTQIISHEEVHIQQKHSIDILGIEILKILFWFNPFLFLYRNLLEEAHEYYADAKAALKTNSVIYTKLLVKSTFNQMGLAYGSHFKKNQVLKRVKMLSEQRKTHVLKLLIPLPIAAMLFFIFSFEAHLYNTIEVNNYTIEEVVFSSNDQLPLPVSGIKSWTNKLEENISYPLEARVKQIEGKVLVSFVVDEKGQLKDLFFKEKIGYGAEEEILHALRKAGKWEPAMIDGKPKALRVSLPVSFKKS